jgi:hypothetical protein
LVLNQVSWLQLHFLLLRVNFVRITTVLKISKLYTDCSECLWQFPLSIRRGQWKFIKFRHKLNEIAKGWINYKSRKIKITQFYDKDESSEGDNRYSSKWRTPVEKSRFAPDGIKFLPSDVTSAYFFLTQDFDAIHFDL